MSWDVSGGKLSCRAKMADRGRRDEMENWAVRASSGVKLLETEMKLEFEVFYIFLCDILEAARGF